MQDVQFATQSYQSDSLPLSAQRCVNAYAERQPQKEAKTAIAVWGCPGIVHLATCGAGPIRGAHVMSGILYVVSGRRLYRVSATGTATDVGGNIAGSGVVSMDDNGLQLMIVNGVNGFVYSITGGFQLVASADFHAAATTTFVDSYFMFDRIDTNQFFISESLDGTTYDSLRFGAAESLPDDVLAVLNYLQKVYVFGKQSIEINYNAGLINFPFIPLAGGLIPRGIMGSYAFTTEDNTIFFGGEDRVAYALKGKDPSRITTHALEQAWQKYTTVSDLSCFAYTWRGHKFINFNFPTANATYVFDIATGLWHERVSFDRLNNSLGRWRVSCAVAAYDKVLVGDGFSGQIGYLSDSVFTEFGNTMQMQLVSPPLHAGGNRLFVGEFQVDMESGVGTSGQGEDPQAMLDWSDDGGRTYTTPQSWHSMGKTGEFQTRLRWLQLGSTLTERVMRLTVTDPVKRVVMGARAEVWSGE